MNRSRARATRLLRSVPVVAVVLAVAVAAGGCSSTLNDAASVGTVRISNSHLRDDLKTIASVKPFAAVLNQGGYKVSTADKTVDRKLAAVWLSELVIDVPVQRELRARHIVVTAKNRSDIRSQFDQQFVDAQRKSFVGSFPTRFLAAWVDRAASVVALKTALAKDVKQPTLSDAQAFYEKNKAQLVPCQSGKTVSHIVVATQAAASAALAQIKGGTSFATVAAQQSTDTATKGSGGVIADANGVACYAGGSDQALDAAVSQATVGTPTGPVKTAAGWEIILVETFQPPSFTQVESQVAQLMQQQYVSQVTAKYNSLIERDLKRLGLNIDPQYGTWVVDQQQGPHVQPPTAPNPRTTRHPTTSTTAPTGVQLPTGSGSGTGQ